MRSTEHIITSDLYVEGNFGCGRLGGLPALLRRLGPFLARLRTRSLYFQIAKVAVRGWSEIAGCMDGASLKDGEL